MADTSCLYTIIKNISGGPLDAPYVPPRGRSLDADEEVSIPFLAFAGFDHKGRLRDNILAALEDHLNEGKITILKSFSPVVQDTVTDLPRVLTVASGTIDTLGACWDPDESES